jgi:hypothetical protein
MRISGKGVVGTALILFVANRAYTAYESYEAQGIRSPPVDEVVWTWMPQSDGHSAFSMIVNATTWRWLAPDGGDQEWKGTRLSDATYSQIHTLVEMAMRHEDRGCPHHWLVTNIKPLPKGSVLLSGRCASSSELRASTLGTPSTP